MIPWYGISLFYFILFVLINLHCILFLLWSLNYIDHSGGPRFTALIQIDDQLECSAMLGDESMSTGETKGATVADDPSAAPAAATEVSEKVC